eukprot:gene5840-8057_t
MLTDIDIATLLEQFPHLVCAFAYGSGVVKQGGYSYDAITTSDKANEDLPLLDFIFVVDNPLFWHQKNLEMNPNHYTSMLPSMMQNAKWISYIQDNYGASMWFNAYIKVNLKSYPKRMIKYGVISKDRFMKDLLEWSCLYVAGRLHKPVRIMKSNDEIKSAINTNLNHAVNTSLLLLPQTFTSTELFLSIASLSYIGDPRMTIGENPKKVQNLVLPIVDYYEELYKEPLSRLSFVSNSNNEKIYSQDISSQKRWELTSKLPLNLSKVLSVSARELYLHKRPPSSSIIRSALSSIVARSATTQSIKGLLSIGVINTAAYIIAKMKKRFFK